MLKPSLVAMSLFTFLASCFGGLDLTHGNGHVGYAALVA